MYVCIYTYIRNTFYMHVHMCTLYQYNETPLTVAVGAGQVETVRLLLDRGVNPDTPDLVRNVQSVVNLCNIDLYIYMYMQCMLQQAHPHVHVHMYMVVRLGQIELRVEAHRRPELQHMLWNALYYVQYMYYCTCIYVILFGGGLSVQGRVHNSHFWIL